jgi:transcriptional regulator with XRE-family HTH domain
VVLARNFATSGSKKALPEMNSPSALGVSKGYLAEIEQNNRSLINPRYIQKIANGLELNPLKLISHNGSLSKKKHFLDCIIPPDTLGARIKNLRLKQGLTFKEFTRRLKVSKDSTWRFEKNITIPNEKILKGIAKILRVSTSELTKNLAKEGN